MPVKVVIRADGNSDIGFGHIIRTQALAQQLARVGAEVLFLSRNAEKIKGFPTIEIPELLDHDEEDHLIGQVIAGQTPGRFIVDSYAFDQKRLDRVAGLGTETVYIDDMNRYEFNTTYLINGNLYAPRLDYRGSARFLLGSKYLLMREQFANTFPRVIKPEVRDILLTFGAADANNLTAQVVGYIKKLPRFFDFQWHVMIGPAFRHASDVEAVAQDCRNILLHYDPDVKNLMEFCDISISAAGSTTYEMAACGLPSMLIVAANNQAMLAEEADRQGLAINLGEFDQFDYSYLESVLNRLLDGYDLRKGMAAAGQSIIDGNGAARTARTLLGL